MFKEEEEKISLDPAQMITEEKDKNRALLAGIIFFMILIIILWVLNTSDIFEISTVREEDSFNINKFSQEFQKSLNSFEAKTSELKQIDPAFLNDIPETSATADIK